MRFGAERLDCSRRERRDGVEARKEYSNEERIKRCDGDGHSRSGGEGCPGAHDCL